MSNPKYLESLELINFGKHKKLKILFDRLITVIQGDTNSGKTTVFRALKLIDENRPSNPERIFNFQHSKSNKFKLTMIKGGSKVIRDKKSYTVGNNTKPKKAFGTNVPEPVRAITHLKDINWQSQIRNQYYLLFDTPGAVAKALNKEMGMEDSTALINATKVEMGTVKGEIKLHQASVVEQREIINHLKPVDELLKEAQAIKKLENEIFEIQHIEVELSKLLTQLEEIELELSEEEMIKNIYKEIEKLEVLKNEIDESYDYINTLSKLVKEIDSQKVIETSILEEISEEIEDLLEIESKIVSLKNKTGKIKTLLSEIETNNRELEEGKKEQTRLETEYQNELSKLKICPFRNVPCPLGGEK